jgi:hypothetical protein
MYDVQVYITNTYNIEEKWTQVREKPHISPSSMIKIYIYFFINYLSLFSPLYFSFFPFIHLSLCCNYWYIVII